MDNNVNVMIFAYKWLVYGGKCEDMLFVSIGTGARVIAIISDKTVCGTWGYLFLRTLWVSELGNI